MRLSDGRWLEALSTWRKALEEGCAEEPFYSGDSDQIVGAFFQTGLSPKVLRERCAMIVGLYRDHEAIPQLGEALIAHLGRLYRSKDAFPTSETCERWASAWEEAGDGIPEFRLPSRIFRAGIDFLKSGGANRGVLLDLRIEERRLLEQALGLDDESQNGV